MTGTDKNKSRRQNAHSFYRSKNYLFADYGQAAPKSTKVLSVGAKISPFVI